MDSTTGDWSWHSHPLNASENPNDIPCPVGSDAFDRGSRIGENLILGRERYKLLPYAGLKTIWRYDFGDFHFGEVESKYGPRWLFWIFPYWLFVPPTALLSGYLILWKPRKRPKREAPAIGD
jgi:hypothetical protein